MDDGIVPRSAPELLFQHLVASDSSLLTIEATCCEDGYVGRGASGEVWEAKYSSGRPPDQLEYEGVIALKILQYTLAGRRVDETTQNRFFKRVVKEVSLWSKLKHPNVLRLLGICLEGSKGYKRISIVMPLMENGSLVDYLQAHPNVDRLRLLRGMADGLTYLHGFDQPGPIIHGDLKCANVLIDGAGIPLLADFGFSMLMDEIRAEHITTTLLDINPRWAAPERLNPERYGLKPHEAFTKASDMYSLGMTIYEMMSDEIPYKGQATLVIANLVMQGTRPPHPGERARQNGLTNGLWSFLNKVWNQRPSQRPDVPDLINMLEAAHEPTRITPFTATIMLSIRDWLQPQESGTYYNDDNAFEDPFIDGPAVFGDFSGFDGG